MPVGTEAACLFASQSLARDGSRPTSPVWHRRSTHGPVGAGLLQADRAQLEALGAEWQAYFDSETGGLREQLEAAQAASGEAGELREQLQAQAAAGEELTSVSATCSACGPDTTLQGDHPTFRDAADLPDLCIIIVSDGSNRTREAPGAGTLRLLHVQVPLLTVSLCSFVPCIAESQANHRICSAESRRRRRA